MEYIQKILLWIKIGNASFNINNNNNIEMKTENISKIKNVNKVKCLSSIQSTSIDGSSQKKDIRLFGEKSRDIKEKFLKDVKIMRMWYILVYAYIVSAAVLSIMLIVTTQDIFSIIWLLILIFILIAALRGMQRIRPWAFAVVPIIAMCDIVYQIQLLEPAQSLSLYKFLRFFFNFAGGIYALIAALKVTTFLKNPSP